MSNLSQNANMIRENILHLTHSCLSHHISNEQRQIHQNDLFHMENNCNPRDFLDAANAILLDVEYAVDTPAFQQKTGSPQAAQSYGERLEAGATYCAQAISRWLASGHAPAEHVRFIEMHAVLTGHLCLISNISQAPPPLQRQGNQNGQPIPRLQAPLRRVHSVALSKTILACAKHLFPLEFPSLFEPFFTITADKKNIEEGSTFTPLLQNHVDAWQLVEFYICNILGLDELHPGPKHLVELEKRALQAVSRNSHGIIACLFGAMESFPGGVDKIPLQIYASLMNIIEALVPHCKPEILTGRPAQLVLYGLRNRTKNVDLVSACGSLFASMCAKRGIITENARGWLRNVIDSLDGLFQNQMWDSVSCFLEGFEELPLDSLQTVAPEVADLAGKVLRTQSLFFSHKMLPILNKLIDSALQQNMSAVADIIPNDLVHSIYELAPRNKSHPRYESRYRCANMSEIQFVSDDQYELTFGEFRGQSSKLLKMYAQIAPKKAADVITKIIESELRPPTPQDQKNRNGHVTMDSNVFFAWDGCLFCMEHLAHCYEVQPRFSAGPVQPAWDALIGMIGKKLEDAVLAPLYLNMMAALWKAPDTPWSHSIDLLLHYSCLKPQNPNLKSLMQDQELTAARRRALTLLVRVCTEHGDVLAPHAEELWKQMQGLQHSNNLLPSESNYLLEAAASLSCVMTDEGQASFLNSFVSEPAQRIILLGSHADPGRLRDLIFSSPPSNQTNGNPSQWTREQQSVVDDLGLLVGITRRVAGKNYARNLMQNLIGPVTNLTAALHQLHSTAPPQFAAAFELPEEVTDAMNQQSGSRHGAVAQANSNHQVDPALRRVRAVVSKLRVNLYHLLPIAMKIFGSVTDQIAGCLTGIQMASLPLHVAKAAVDNLFVLAIELYPPCLPLCTNVVCPLFINSAMRHNQPQNNNNNSNYNNNNRNNNIRNNNNMNNNVMISRQLYFIYKNFFNAIRVHVLQPKLHERNRDICVALVQFLMAVMGNCPDALLASCRDSASILVEIPDDQIAADLFVALCRAIGGPGQGLSKRDLEMVAGDAFNVYSKNFNRFSTLLQKALPPHFGELISRFHGALSTLQRFYPKRTRFIEFCIQLCS